jgi:septum formation protein
MSTLKNLDKYNIILASQSPRRRELLSGLNIDFRVKTIEVDEDYPSNLYGEEIPMYLAEKKALAYKSTIKDNDMFITADTIVICENKVLNKPTDQIEARSMLKTLSNKTHQVITGVCIQTIQHKKVFSVKSDVKFAELTDAEIDYYIETYSPMDKAGAYGIQEWIGFAGVESINGSYFNIMGFPIQRVYTELKNWPK